MTKIMKTEEEKRLEALIDPRVKLSAESLLADIAQNETDPENAEKFLLFVGLLFRKLGDKPREPSLELGRVANLGYYLTEAEIRRLNASFEGTVNLWMNVVRH